MNPLAVELAKVSLWLTTLAYDRPLSFFDHHLRCGNSLLGAPLRDEGGALTSDCLAAFSKVALADVDKEATPAEKALLKRARQRNNSELRKLDLGQLAFFEIDLRIPLQQYALARAELSLDDPTQSAHDAAERTRRKERLLQELTNDPRGRFYLLNRSAISGWRRGSGLTTRLLSHHRLVSFVSRRMNSGITVPRRRNGQRTCCVLAGESRTTVASFTGSSNSPRCFSKVASPHLSAIHLGKKCEPSRRIFGNDDPLFRQYDKQLAKRKAAELREDSLVNAHFERIIGDRFSSQRT